MSYESEKHYKTDLIEETFELHDIDRPATIKISRDGKQEEYRNRNEISWQGDREKKNREQ